jgi:hypothetical protein
MLSGITTHDTGLGTTYERWSLNALLDSLRARLEITSVLEGPDDGMTGIAGINSLILARGGAHVTVCLPDAERAAFAHRVWTHYGCEDRVRFVQPAGWGTDGGPYDLVWSFNVLPRTADPERTLDDMIGASSRFILLFVPNRANYSFWLHRLHHRVADEEWDHGPVPLLSVEPWCDMLRNRGLAVRETMLVDVPWWPDIVDAGKLLADLIPPLAGRFHSASPENRYRWAVNDLPYYDAERYADVHLRMKRLAFIERSRWRWLRTRFAHHVGVLAEKTDGSLRS